MKADELLIERGNGLHLGGTVAKAGWKVLSAQPGEHVDFIGDLRDMGKPKGYTLSSASFDMVYASHVIEHLGYAEDLPRVLEEVARILRPGGRFFVSVPDLETLCRLFLAAQNTVSKNAVMQMMFGGQVDEYDFHYVGLFEESLAQHLAKAGFREVYRVPRFGLFDDTSNMAVAGTLISLNVVAVR